jgi:hypothetical protein
MSDIGSRSCSPTLGDDLALTPDPFPFDGLRTAPATEGDLTPSQKLGGPKGEVAWTPQSRLISTA